MKKWPRRLAPSAMTRGKWFSVFAVLAMLSLSLAVVSNSLPHANASAASNLIASDTFNRTISNGWGTANKGGAWTVLDSPTSWSVAPGVGKITTAANLEYRAVLNSVAVQDVSLLAKIVLPRCSDAGTNCDAYVIGRYNGGSSPSYYRIGVVQGAGQQTVYLRSQRGDGSTISSDINTGIAAATNVTLWIRVQFIGINPTVIHAHVWKNGTTEPTTWLLNTTDTASAEQVAGAVGVRVRNEDSATSHLFRYQTYKAFSLASGTPTPTPSPTMTMTATGTPTVSKTYDK